MQSKAATPKQYLNELPEERKEPIQKLRQQILDNLPDGMEERMSYGMLGYVVPHSVYPDGYHCTPELPLPFMNLASQKNFIGVYSMAIYANKELSDWFTTEYTKRCKYKVDMGKSCIRLKRMNDIPYELIGELTARMTTDDWIKLYEDSIKNRK